MIVEGRAVADRPSDEHGAGVPPPARDSADLPHPDPGHLPFLAEASRALADTLDYEATLQAAARLAVPYLADFCLIDLLTEAGQPTRVAVAHPDPAQARPAPGAGRALSLRSEQPGRLRSGSAHSPAPGSAPGDRPAPPGQRPV